MPESKAAYDNLPVRYPGLTSEDLETFLKGKLQGHTFLFL